MRKRIKNLLLPVASIAAAGTEQADATAMGTNACVSVSGADGSAGVKLPEPSNGRQCMVYNEHATAGLKIYPHVGGDINDGTEDAAITIEGKTMAVFHALDGTTWAAQYTADS